MAMAGKNLAKLVDSSIEPSIDYYIDKSDWLLHQTYLMALEYSTKLDVCVWYPIAMRLLILIIAGGRASPYTFNFEALGLGADGITIRANLRHRNIGHAATEL